MNPTCKYPLDLFDRFEFKSYGHAMEILADSFPTEWGEIRKALERLKISTDELKQAGGNETAMPKKFARGDRSGWDMRGNQADETYEPTWKTYANHTVAAKST